jgi:hypothetical protein
MRDVSDEHECLCLSSQDLVHIQTATIHNTKAIFRLLIWTEKLIWTENNNIKSVQQKEERLCALHALPRGFPRIAFQDGPKHRHPHEQRN